MFPRPINNVNCHIANNLSGCKVVDLMVVDIFTLKKEIHIYVKVLCVCVYACVAACLGVCVCVCLCLCARMGACMTN